MKKSDETQAMTLQVTDEISVEYVPSQEHEYLMTTEQVAKGYGISVAALRSHKYEHQDELVEGKHFITCIQSLNPRVGKTNADRKSATYKQVLWTKRGIVRLGFFVKSELAKVFRDLTEDLVIKMDERMNGGGLANSKPGVFRNGYNRLTPERLLALMIKVSRISDDDLRVSIVNDLTGGC